MSEKQNMSESGDDLTVLIPAFNEEPAIFDTLMQLTAALPKAQIVVIDDGSTDGTAERAREVQGVTVLQHEFNQGYGSALKTGVRACKGSYIAWFDADNEHRSEDLVGMVERLREGRLAAVLGERSQSSGAARSLAKWVIRLLAISLNIDLKKDVNCGLRVFRASVLKRYLHLLPSGFSASMTSTMVLLERGYPIEFYPIKINPRIGKSKVKVKDGFRTLALVLRTILLFSPLRFFLPVGAAFAGIGLLYGVPTAVMLGKGFPTLAALSIIVGVLAILIGLVADQISQIRLNQMDDFSNGD